MINVTIANFEAEVIAASMHTPVLVDFWAPWCGPCKVIGPLLEKLEADYGGRFKLVKIDSDQEQQLAAAFGVRSIPTCILLKNGQPVDGFMGALPEGQIKAFLDKNLPSEEALLAQSEEADALEALAEGDTETARQKLEHALATDPSNADVRYDLVKLLLMSGELAEAEALLAPALAEIPRALRFEALRQWLEAVDFVQTDPRGQWDLAQFDGLIAQNKRDFDTRYAKARLLMVSGELAAAMDELLEIVLRDKKWNDEAGRKTYVAILELMTPPKPKNAEAVGKSAGGIELMGKAARQVDPQAELLAGYRRKLSMALN